MIEFKRISFKYVVLAFLVAACLIILLSIDRKNNEAPPIEDVFIEELFKLGSLIFPVNIPYPNLAIPIEKNIIKIIILIIYIIYNSWHSIFPD